MVEMRYPRCVRRSVGHPLISVSLRVDIFACRARRRMGQPAVRSGNDGGIGRRNARMEKVSGREKSGICQGGAGCRK